MIELRLDLIGPRHLPLLLSACPKPAVVTCRTRLEGGAFRGSESDRIAILHAALNLGAAYIDIELGAFSRVKETIDLKRVIVSAHFFGGRTRDVKSLYRRMKATHAGVLKFAYSASDSWKMVDVLTFLELANRDGRKAIAIAMGEAGEPSRILYKNLGGWATYAAAEVGPEAAPGQVTGRTLRRVYRAPALTRRTKVFGVIGNPVRQSKGIYLHNALFHNDHLNDVYVRFPVVDVGRFMKVIAPRLSGFSVTVPHKEKNMHYLSSVSGDVATIQAANTVLVRGKRFVGENTDAPGALDAIEARLAVRGKHMLILGAGGAARAIVHEAIKRGCAVTIANRTGSRAQQLARATGARSIAWKEMVRQRFDIIVNTTSVGMIPHINRSPISPREITAQVVFDVVYNPPITKLLRDAQRRGATIIPGTEMYINQAARQYVLYTGRTPSLAVMKRALRGDA